MLQGARARHSGAAPALLMPEAIAAQEPGSRKALNDRSLFRPLVTTPPPRWDLSRTADYRAMMMQTTVGCRFRCDFCDIIQFNGGFRRPKTLESVRTELATLYALGFRGGIVTVDDNLVGNPAAIESILPVMIDFQRAHDYPFSFYTQAGLDLGSPKLAHLLPLMKHAGVSEVFLGIENPDPAALNGMNKKQNTKVDIAATVRTIQRAGIEVMAGFIFGSGEDTVETADAITTFATQAAIPTAMTGMLTPIPHTPLRERLRLEGRLHEAEFAGNNTDDSRPAWCARARRANASRAALPALHSFGGFGGAHAALDVSRTKPVRSRMVAPRWGTVSRQCGPASSAGADRRVHRGRRRCRRQAIPRRTPDARGESARRAAWPSP